MNLIGIASILFAIGWICISLLAIYFFVRTSRKMDEDFEGFFGKDK